MAKIFFSDPTKRPFPWPNSEGRSVPSERRVLMTAQERIQIVNLQKQGYGYKYISSATGIALNAVKTFCRRNPVAQEKLSKLACRYCGKKLTTQSNGRPKQYCSDSCRMAWWKEHRNDIDKRTFYKITCQHCGVEFESYGFAGRKYCSRTCFALARTKEVRHEQ